MAEREGFEPPCRLPDKTLSRRPRYDHFGTSPLLLRSRPLRGAFAVRSLFDPRLGVFTASPLAEEVLDQLAALGFEDTPDCLHPVIQRRMLVRAHR